MRANTSAMRQRLLVAAFTMVITACASSPVYYEYRPTESPLRYDFTASVANEIETPGGMQTSGGESEAIVAVSIGVRTDSGTVFSVIFDSFSVAGSDADAGDLGVEAMEGATFLAALRPTGAVDILEAPEFELEGVTADDLAGIVISLIMPLPPGGTVTSESWPHRVESPVGAGLEGLSTYDGVARLAGDTTWNGIPAQKIVSEGNWVLTAAGTPPGSPTEIELQMEGTSSTTYFWDPARGVMLGAEAAAKGSGNVMAMGFEMPISNTASSTIALQ